MGQITRTTNPTGLQQIDRKHFAVRLSNDANGARVFWLDSFDYEAAKLESSVQIGCIAYAGGTEEYFDLGLLSDFKKVPMSLRAITSDRPVRFRFIFNKPGESLLVGYTDGVRALDEAGNLGSSLVDIEPTDLQGIAWILELPKRLETSEKPNILVERALFPSAISAVNHPWFGVLVMPEVMRQIAMVIAENSASLDDTETWIAPWAEFIAALGVSPPTESEDDEFEAQSCADEVVKKFAERGIFTHNMTQVLAEMEGVQP